MKSSCYINNEVYLTESTYQLISPIDGSILGYAADACAADVNIAVEAAEDAYHREWRFYDSDKKWRLFEKLINALSERSDAIHQGAIKPISGVSYNTRPADISKEEGDDLFTRLIRYYMGYIGKDYGDVLEYEESHMNFVQREPLGVVAVMVPFNSPTVSILLSALPALVAGNTVVIKAPEEEPFQAAVTVEAFLDAGFPPGVINFVSGKGPETGKALANHSRVRLISFSGSVQTAQKIMEAAASNLKRTHFNLGSKTAQIVLADADLEKVTDAVVKSAFPGQACSAVSRVFVEKSIAGEYKKKVLEKIAKLEPSLLVSSSYIERMQHYVEIAKKDGKIIAGGAPVIEGDYAKGCYYQPTVVELNTTDSKVYQDEIFGPLLAILEFEDDESMLSEIHKLDFGLLTSIWGRDNTRIDKLIRRLEMGIVIVNRNTSLTPHAPWGGRKLSGHGRHYGKYALESFYDYKNVWKFNP